MANDNKKAKADPAPKSEAAAKDKSTAGEAVSKTKGSEAAAAAPSNYSPGGRPETGHHGLQGKLERDFLEEEREEEKAIIRATRQEKRPGINPGPSSFRLRVGLIVHAAHAAARHSRGPTVLLRPFGDHGFRGD
jgi:hypothetical protein